MSNIEQHQKGMVENYFALIENLSDGDKIELIARISNSIIERRQQKHRRTKEEILKKTYGCFESSKTADEIIDEIYNSRHFANKNLQL